MMYKHFSFLLSTLLLLTSCSSKNEILKGDRIAVLKTGDTVEKDASLEQYDPEILPPQFVSSWAQADQNATHLMPHAVLSEHPKLVWKKSVGTGSGSSRKLLSPPIVFDQQIMTIDTYGRVSAHHAETGVLVWEFKSRPPKQTSVLANGGLAYDQGKVFVATDFAILYAIDAKTGKEIWQTELSAPLHSAPIASNGRVFAVTIDNALSCLSQEKGEILWQHQGITEYAGLLGGASPAVQNDLVFAPFSSGEVTALKVETGRPVWSEALTSLRRTDSVSAISTIKGSPVVDQNMTFIIGHGNRMFALDTKTGDQIWEKHIGGLFTPLLHNDVLFVLSLQNQLLCMKKETGQIVWTTQLEKTFPKSKKLLNWAGPILAGNKLFLSNSMGNLVAFDPKSGKMLDTIALKDAFLLPPIAVNSGIYLFSESGRVYFLK